MRWLFLDPATKEERRRRASAVEAIDAFWAAFAEKAGAIDAHLSGADPAFDLKAFLDERLRQVHDGLTWETGPAVLDGGHRLVLTTARDEALRALVAALVERAPALPRFEVHAHRPAEVDLRRVVDRVAARLGLPAAGLRGRFAQGAGHRLDLTVTCPGLALEAGRAAGLVVAEALLGELEAVTWLGAVTSVAPTTSGEWLELANLVGPKSYVKERVAAFKEAGVTVLSVNPVGPNPVQQIEQLREIVDG